MAKLRVLARVLLCEHDSHLTSILVDVLIDDEVDVITCSSLADVEAGPRGSYLALIDRPRVALKPELARI